VRFFPIRLSFVLLAAACLLGLSADALAAEAPQPTPTCAEGPTRAGDAILGTPCADTIVVPPGVESVQGGGGDDTIVAAPIAASAPCPADCRLGVGSQTYEGGPGDDIVLGERGNDILQGGEGNDQLFGGIGDDLLQGGPGADRLSGGFGADSIDGEAGDDYVRGDGTIDRIFDTGGGTDTLSYATGITPGFGGTAAAEYAGFPPASGERGVRLELSAPGENGNDGVASFGGGVDEVEGQSFERIVGTPFSDFIVGTEGANTIYGGGGADVILGLGGNDALIGGADGDDLDGGFGADAFDGGAGTDHCQDPDGPTGCEATSKAVVTRDSSKVSVGMTTGAPGLTQVYVAGSAGIDTLTATYSGAAVTLSLAAGAFDTSAGADGGCAVTASTATCALATPLDAILLAGLGGEDTIAANGFPGTAGVVVLGGEGNDQLTGGDASEDVLVDGPGSGADLLSALGSDDALLHNGGADEMVGGDGNDLFLSVSICDEEVLRGGTGRDNASWARLTGEGVEARLDQGLAGQPGSGGAVACPGDEFDTLQEIEDLEGSVSADVFFGDAGPNQLLGHPGPDTYFALAGADSILANSADSDPLIDCGEGTDSALIDIPHPGEYEDAAPVGCETVRQAAPNNFRTVTQLPPPPRPPVLPPPPHDRKPPQTRITAGPARLLFAAGRHRRVVFRFASSERGSTFRCKLDARPYRRCTSPHAFVVGRGAHAVRIAAVDAAGNVDRTPALFRFRVRSR
jgi:Ca2+-binding RTX toxin-like protein